MKTKNSHPSSEFESKDRCPSCGSYCDIHIDLDDNDECNDCKIFEDNLETASIDYRDKSDDENTDEETMLINVNWYDKQQAFIAGAKWQAKRMYSEEELKSAFKIGFNIGYGSTVQELDLKNEYCEKWFEQFKKK
jgi:formylmethanofuran dehydrogenase subunit B